jgi:flavin-dependent dehydrogenase
VIIGGGPAGSSAGRLLASWGHRVLLLDGDARADAACQSTHGLAESLPPSSTKLLTEIGILSAVEQAGFYRSTGNTVWWGSGDRRIETFGGTRGASGFLVYRPDFDRLLLGQASAAGVDVKRARVRTVTLDEESARVSYEEIGQPRRATTVPCRFVLDCSGRAGVLARRVRVPGLRMYALVGQWRSDSGWDLPDPTHTAVEAYVRGWAWSVPISPQVRHAGLMIDGRSPRAVDGRALADAYRAELAQTSAMDRVLGGATLERAWACDASTYSSSTYAGPQFLLVGDAGSFIDPLSSYGVERALASAWVAAIAMNTCLTDPSRQACALDFFSTREREMCASHARRARDFARDAAAKHSHPFWATRASARVEDELTMSASAPELHAALHLIRESAELELTLDDRVTFERRPVICGREIVL